MSEIIICDECGIFKVPDDLGCCRVCFSVLRGIPHDHMTGLEFDSFRHRMLKKEREENARVRRSTENERKAMSTQRAAMERVERDRHIGNFAGTIRFCKACSQAIGRFDPCCGQCFNRNMFSLRRTGLPYVPPAPTPGASLPEIKGVLTTPRNNAK